MSKKKTLLVDDTKFQTASEKIWRNKVFGPDNFRAATVSHYLRNNDKKLKKPALRYGEELLNGFLKDTTSIVEESALQYLIKYQEEIPFPKPENPMFTFIDLFAGIGGFRIAMQNNGGECVFSSEWDKMAQRTYYANFGEIPFGDITKEDTKKWIPENFDLLCGGFPCQPFSIAGVSKKNALGRKHGFEDEKQGNLFFHIAEIIEKHRPKAYFLENVKNLVSHDKGNTFKTIKETLEGLNYTFDYMVLNGKHFVPQNRARTFMVGFDKNHYRNDMKFIFPEMPEANHKVKDILEKKVEAKYTLTDHLWKYLQDYAKKHNEKGNGFGFGLVDFEGITRTMSARYYKDGSEILIPQKNKNPRRLTPRESARLLGYPENFRIEVSDGAAYKQFGNSVVMPLIQTIGEKISKLL